ncbi:MAG: 4Fe-4S dicluster domain-containing protein [Candidatus Thermoplasmatota archaeon]|nr:4Fe-4S dicluster domain-containing protein [Candidatus Thermoplasmatota archaeon]
MRSVFVTPEHCIGCKHCEIACAVEHSKSKDLFQAISESPISRPRIYVEPGIDYLTFPSKCRHCDPAPCLQVCPTNAIYRDRETEFVEIDHNRCIGCQMCAIVCPFGVISFGKTWEAGIHNVNIKCDGCIDRLKEKELPACVEACKTGALEFGEINELIKKSRRDFTLRVTMTPEAAEEIPAIPPNIKLFRELMKEMEYVGPFEAQQK